MDDYDFEEHAEEVAAERGQIVVLPKANQLQIDIDSEEAHVRLCEDCHNSEHDAEAKK